MAKKKPAELSAAEMKMGAAVRDFVTDAEDLEKTLIAHVQDGGNETTLDPHVTQYMLSVLGLSKWEIKRRISRTAAMLRHQAVAGCSKSRGDLDKALSEAEQELATKGAELEQSILKQQRELKVLQGSRDELARRQSEVQQACNNLREDSMLPDHIVSNINIAVRELKGTTGKQLGEARGQLRNWELLLVAQGTPEHIDRVRLVDQELVKRVVSEGTTPGRGWQHYELSGQWPAFAAKLPTEIAELKADIAKLEDEFERGMLKINQMRDYHLAG